jgi:methionyl aminopeptidase
MIQIKTPDEIALMREAGLITQRALAAMRAAVRPGITTGELDRIAEDSIRSEGAVPSFLGYRGFTGTICASINDEVVHGIPSRKRKLREGDIISLDCGAIFEGWHGDSAITRRGRRDPPGTPAAHRRHRAGAVGRAGRGGRRGPADRHQRGGGGSIRSHPHHYGIVDHYGGHGIGTEMHQDPHVLNHGRPGAGPRLVPGLALAIEPMVTLGGADTRELPDGWTVVTTDGSYAAHWEHTVAITEDGPWVTTAEDGGFARLAELGVKVAQRA